MSDARVTIVGAGLAGCLLARMLARRGYHVQLFERLPDMRRTPIPAGRSINLALAARGIRALEVAGVLPEVLPLLIPMRGRLLHADDGSLTFLPYGQREQEVIYSVSRPGLNRVLLDAAEQAGVSIHFEHAVVAVDFDRRTVRLQERSASSELELPLTRVIACDGAGSILRHELVRSGAASAREDLLPHGYKELTLPARADGRHALERNALHIWPRGGFMLIALPNLDGSFTVTLFLPHTGATSFASLDGAERIGEFFAVHFADACALMPSLADEFTTRPTGIMGTVRCDRWALADGLLLLGDAAHAITPFHGQGMNCAFEDCAELDALLQQETDWAAVFARFERKRIPNTNAIADMALENYVEMRDAVRDPKFQLQKALSLELERRHPERFIPRYSMVMFHDEIPYRAALERGVVQNAILGQLTAQATTLGDIDYAAAERLIIERLPPLTIR